MKALRWLFVLPLLLVPTSARAGGCWERSDIVGLQRCSHYGRKWSLEGQLPILFVFGFRYSQIGVSGLTFEEDAAKQNRPDGYQAYRYQGQSLGLDSLNVFGMEGGIQLFVWRQLYKGVQGALSLGESRLASFRTESGIQLSGDTGVNVVAFHGAIPVGYRFPLGRAALRPEVDFGVDEITVNHRIDAPGTGLPDSGTASASRFVVEPRLGADIWVTPHLSFGAYAAVDVLAHDVRSRAFGFAFVWHNRSFDGDTSF